MCQLCLSVIIAVIFIAIKCMIYYSIIVNMPSVLWRCWLGGRKGIQPVKKTERWGAGVVICLERGADAYGPADATATHCLLLQ